MIILIGPSASGKTEIARLLEKKYNIKKITTHTTRAIRENEVQDVDYHFVSRDHFLSMIKNNELVEYNLYNNNYYGTSKKELGNNKVVVIDPNGANAIKNLNLKNCFFVYLECSEQICLQRMILRKDKKELIDQRIAHDKDIFSLDKINYIINTETKNIAELTEEIYQQYLKFIK